MIKVPFFIFLGLSPLLFNDLIFPLVKSPAIFLSVDYSFRTFSLILFIFLFKDISSKNLALNKPIWINFLALLPLVLGFNYLISFPLSELFYQSGFDTYRLYSFPKVLSKSWLVFDILCGLSLVAITEEIIFRGYIHHILSKKYNPPVFVLLSSLLFSFIHWGLGPVAQLTSFLAGISFHYIRIKTNSIIPAILVHYLVNLVLFYW